ncbi:DUF350 domain-containing protein [Aliivibrio fischeri]|uniref:DUF350 domain-containing protein n=1 Tax=Aliivibrio fischeri TaxID=668 RepID=UPI0007C57529|nr:DUF350 domain-containing protein [Aliivibrio fischeri]MBP3140033.1 DUF350 domain-containing protein [Aliivibrio fischeri]MBP3154414.1 DUF350 domain-containing protein [Aliivibrio fischeri]MCE7572154.1 DUF350 domain-containing protein [Aliivibrio fischeri]MUK94625.1 DUF350 domain-containing protein [Aliivibrio fischeri]
MINEYINTSGFLLFLGYFATSIIFLVCFKFLYLFCTPYDELKLIQEEKNCAASITLSGALIGYAIAIASASSNSVGFVDFIIWGVIAAIAQVFGFWFLKTILLKDLVSRIKDNEIPAAIITAAFSISIGLLNAAGLTY